MSAPVIVPAPYKFKGARIRASTAGALPANTETLIPFNVCDFDIGGFYNALNPERLTIPAGIKKVRITVNISLNGAVTNARFRVFKNGLAFNGMLSVDNSNDPGFCGSCLVDVVQGDYFEFYGRQSSGATRYINDIYHCFMCVEGVE